MLTFIDLIEALTNYRSEMANIVITEAAIDSRQVIPGALFIAIPGENVDGHAYAFQAFLRGAVAALIEHELDETESVTDSTHLILKGLAP
ncbi:MAG: Mur ligase domain-containing protein, partial [Chloroflexota bacterium]